MGFPITDLFYPNTDYSQYRFYRKLPNGGFFFVFDFKTKHYYPFRQFELQIFSKLQRSEIKSVVRALGF